MTGAARLDAGLLQDRPDSAGRDPDTEPGKLALDPAVACGVRKVGSAANPAIFAHAIEFTHPQAPAARAF
jgi:hypothetical protein